MLIMKVEALFFQNTEYRWGTILNKYRKICFKKRISDAIICKYTPGSSKMVEPIEILDFDSTQSDFYLISTV